MTIAYLIRGTLEGGPESKDIESNFKEFEVNRILEYIGRSLGLYLSKMVTKTWILF